MNQFRNMRIESRIGSPYIPKLPGESLGATLNFEHKGPGCTFWIGIGIAYGKLVGHNPPFQFICKQNIVSNHIDWTAEVTYISGILDINTDLGQRLDCQKFISDTEPIPGQQPPNPYGANNWDDEVYGTPSGDVGILQGSTYIITVLGTIAVNDLVVNVEELSGYSDVSYGAKYKIIDIPVGIYTIRGSYPPGGAGCDDVLYNNVEIIANQATDLDIYVDCR